MEKLIARDLHRMADTAYEIRIFLPEGSIHRGFGDLHDGRSFEIRRSQGDPRHRYDSQRDTYLKWPWFCPWDGAVASDPWSLLQRVLGKAARGKNSIKQDAAQRLLACMYEGYLPGCGALALESWASYENRVVKVVRGRMGEIKRK